MQINDQRGAVLHMLRSDAPDFDNFGECYFSEVKPKVVKAWKYHHIQAQNLVVPIGRVRVVVYDDRGESTSRGEVQILELGRPDEYFRLHIPPQLWYGFQCLSDSPALLANCTNFLHDPMKSELRAVDDANIPYQWEIV